MKKTPTKEIMTDDIIYRKRRETPPDSGGKPLPPKPPEAPSISGV